VGRLWEIPNYCELKLLQKANVRCPRDMPRAGGSGFRALLLTTLQVIALYDVTMSTEKLDEAAAPL
jgi:hypothetical protein